MSDCNVVRIKTVRNTLDTGMIISDLFLLIWLNRIENEDSGVVFMLGRSFLGGGVPQWQIRWQGLLQA